MSISAFVHLRCRSAYSILEGALQPKDIADLCVAHSQPAAAITDTNNLYGALEFSDALSQQGVQPIIGITLKVFDAAKAGFAPDLLGDVVLLAQNEAGYERLMALSSSAFIDSGDRDAGVFFDQVLQDTDGLICLTGGSDGVIDRAIAADKIGQAEDLLRRLAGAFPDRLYVELHRHGLPDQRRVEPVLLDMAATLDLPAVAAQHPHFATPDKHGSHDALLCIGESTYLSVKDRRRVTRDHYFMSSDEMAERFKDLPEALANTVDIARRCAYLVPFRKPILPRFTTDAGRDEPSELKAQAEEGLRARLKQIELAAPEQEYWDRLEHELNVITQMGFPGYFLIVADFIKWAKSQGISVGPGRGSGAGSLVAWVLTITNLDPLRFGLLFERFLNPERVSMPDFDIDFCQERRGEVIDYVQRKYGDDRVAQIITFGKLQARAVVRDVGRVMQLPLGLVDRLAKMVPANPANPVTLQEAINIEPRLRAERDREAAIGELLDTALEIEGLYRNASTHAAGVVIGDRPLKELVALYQDPRSDLPATQFNMKWVEQAGLVKFDFLGLKTLTVIERTLGFLSERGVEIDLDAVGLDDAKTFELLSSGAAIGVFQLESTGMRETLRKMRPDKFEDIIALISLYRPGPMKNIDVYVDRKFGRAEIDYLHPTLEPVLKETYGVIIYQEQVMQIAQILAGYSLGEADLLRRAMGKKKKEEMAKQRARFFEGAAKRGVEEKRASEIFDLVEEFAGYGFNKSHAAAYALIAYQTGYLKANYPVEFMAGLMSLDLHMTEKLAGMVQEARRVDAPVRPPCINTSRADFAVKDGKILYALGALKSVGEAAMEAVVGEREANGAFKSMSDFAQRVDPKALNKRLFQTLARAGAFDCLNDNRAEVVASAQMVLGHAQAAEAERATSQGNLFGGGASGGTAPELPRLREVVEPWASDHALEEERTAVGFFLSGHPLEMVEGALRRRGTVFCAEFGELAREGRASARVCGVVQRRQERKSAKSGETFAFIALSDPTGEFEALVTPDVLSKSRDKLEAGMRVSARARIDTRDGGMRLILDDVTSLDEALAGAYGGICVTVVDQDGVKNVFDRLKGMPEAPPGGVGLVHVQVATATHTQVEIMLPGAHPVHGAARAALEATKGVACVREM